MPSEARFAVGQRVHHKLFDYRGVVVGVDQTFQLTEEWYEEVAKSRPPKDQPFYHLLAENDSDAYHAYVSEQNLLQDESGEPLLNPEVSEVFGDFLGDHYELPASYRN